VGLDIQAFFFPSASKDQAAQMGEGGLILR
jgi:hypothetical protein